MRERRGSFVLAFAAMLAASACDAPTSSKPVGAAVVAPPPVRQLLPAPVAVTVAKLREIAASGTYRDMARLADATPGFRSNNGGMSHQDYWYLKMRAGDWPMAQADALFDYDFAVKDSAVGKVYIWPWMATLEPDEITPQAERDIARLLGQAEVDALRKGAVWPGYVLGIAGDGTWLYFVSGSG